MKKETEKRNDMKWDLRKIKKRMKWNWFELPVEVKHINEYLFPDAAQSPKNKTWQWMMWRRTMAKMTEMKYQTKVNTLANLGGQGSMPLTPKMREHDWKNGCEDGEILKKKTLVI